MKRVWDTKRIGDVCDLATGGTPSRTKPEYFGGDIRWLVSGDIHQQEIFECEGRITQAGMNDSNARILPINSVLIALNGQGKTRGTVALLRTQATCNQSMVSITPKPSSGLLPEFLFANLHGRYEEIRRITSDADNDRRGLNMGLIRSIEIPVAPINEQQRIVGILDEAFAGIATAKANAEKNLQNARALFESHLQSVFTLRGHGWVDRQLDSLCREITVGHVGSMKTEYKETGIPFLRSQNIRPFEVSLENAMFIDDAFHLLLKKSRLRPGDLAIVRTGYPGTAAVIPPELLDSNCSDLVIVRPSDEVDPHFLAAFFNSAFGKQLVLGKIVGAAQKHFNVTAAKDVMLHLPPMAEQQKIIAMVDALRAETQRLAAIYERKLAALEALKKSLLHQAFSGALTKDWRESKIIPFPVAMEGIKTTDMHVGILAMAYRLHEQHGKQNDFGHVKAEKIAHMVEAFAGIDLGREPIQDAAGPNDFNHLKKVEHRARMADHFNFKRSEGRGPYRVTKLPKFDAAADRAEAALGDRKDDVLRLLEVMTRMEWRKAEIFATTFAAWNNLLLDGKPISDEAIVLEARENWHEDKLAIDRDRFFKAIEWMRKEGFVPQGRGKRVIPKKG